MAYRSCGFPVLECKYSQFPENERNFRFLKFLSHSSLYHPLQSNCLLGKLLSCESRVQIAMAFYCFYHTQGRHNFPQALVGPMAQGSLSPKQPGPVRHVGLCQLD